MPVQKKNNKKGKRYCFTFNYKTDEERDDFKEKFLKFCEAKEGSGYIFGEEVAPTTGQLHYQGYVQFKTDVRFERLRKMGGLCRWFPAKGTCAQNQKYCDKGKNIITVSKYNNK